MEILFKDLNGVSDELKAVYYLELSFGKSFYFLSSVFLNNFVPFSTKSFLYLYPLSDPLMNIHFMQFSHFLTQNFTMDKLLHVSILILIITNLTMKLNKPSRSGCANIKRSASTSLLMMRNLNNPSYAFFNMIPL